MERIYAEITLDDLQELYIKAKERFTKYFKEENRKYLEYYDFDFPYCVALCQGAALHYLDKENGVKDFDVWFFYDKSVLPLPHRKRLTTIFSNHSFPDRRIDILFRNIYVDKSKSVHENISAFLRTKNPSPQALSKNPVVIWVFRSDGASDFGQTVPL